MSIKFGTDGWRAVISDTFTYNNLRLVAQAIADYVLREGDNGRDAEVIIGFDTRFLSDRYATEVARVMAGNGIVAWLTRADAPTPAISYSVVEKKAAAGIMITASHNPPRYNGLKLKAGYGGAASPQQARRHRGSEPLPAVSLGWLLKQGTSSVPARFSYLYRFARTHAGLSRWELRRIVCPASAPSMMNSRCGVCAASGDASRPHNAGSTW